MKRNQRRLIQDTQITGRLIGPDSPKWKTLMEKEKKSCSLKNARPDQLKEHSSEGVLAME
jgi:hypothetical protein